MPILTKEIAMGTPHDADRLVLLTVLICSLVILLPG